MKKQTIIGTPISPAHLLEQLRGYGFCVSYAYRTKMTGQLPRLMELVGDDQMLLLDNGAFTVWRKGGTLDPEGFEAWAAPILEQCPQAVAVIPDVIGGSVDENVQLVHECQLDMARCMPVWHLHEPFSYLVYLIESGFSFVALGSSGEYAKPGTAQWHKRVAQAFAVIDELCADGTYARPHIHMMRAQQFAAQYDFDSTDSSNVAVNHHTYKHQGGDYVRRFAKRVSDRIEASCDMVPRVDSPATVAAHAAAMAAINA